MSPLFDSGGVSLHYEVEGDGPAILLTHGFSSTGAMWAPQRPLLARSYKVVTWDVRGHGRSESPPSLDAYSAEHATADMVRLLDHLGIEQAVIGGLSLGGYLSLRFALEHPQRVRALVICDSGPGYRNPEARQAWNDNAEARAKLFEEKGLESLSTSTPERRQSVRLHRSVDGLILAARGLLTQHDGKVMEGLSTITVPTLIVVGADDEPFLGAAKYMARKIFGARHEVIEGGGHAVNLDQPEAFYGVLDSFLSSLPPTQ